MKRKFFLAAISFVILSASILYFTHDDKELSTQITEAKKIDVGEEDKTKIEEIDTEQEDDKLTDKPDVENKQVNSSSSDIKPSQNNENKVSNISNSQNSYSSNKKTESNSSNNEVKTDKKIPKEESVVNTNTTKETTKENDNSVNKNSLDYSTHKGRIDNCDSSSSCMGKAISFYLKYKKNISNYYVIDVIANNGNVLGYFIEYVFKEANYDTESECNSVGNNIKSELSDRITGYKCSNRENKYYLNITTDYD